MENKTRKRGWGFRWCDGSSHLSAIKIKGATLVFNSKWMLLVNKYKKLLRDFFAFKFCFPLSFFYLNEMINIHYAYTFLLFTSEFKPESRHSQIVEIAKTTTVSTCSPLYWFLITLMLKWYDFFLSKSYTIKKSVQKLILDH